VFFFIIKEDIKPSWCLTTLRLNGESGD